jgi:hypothetical protein
MALEDAQERAHAVRPYGGMARRMGRKRGGHGAGEQAGVMTDFFRFTSGLQSLTTRLNAFMVLGAEL